MGEDIASFECANYKVSAYLDDKNETRLRVEFNCDFVEKTKLMVKETDSGIIYIFSEGAKQ